MRWSIPQLGAAREWGWGVGPLPTHLGHGLEEGTTSISHHLEGTSSPGNSPTAAISHNPIATPMALLRRARSLSLCMMQALLPGCQQPPASLLGA